MENKENAENMGKELFDLEKKFWQAMKDHDVETMVSMTDEPCIVTGSQGVYSVDKKAMAGMMDSANYTLDKFELKDYQVKVIDEDTAVIAYKVHEEMTVEGKPVTLDAADASTWVRKDGKWVCALHTESISGDPFGRDKLH
jgi:hypothetical protein